MERVCVITGATGTLGRELVERFKSQGDNVLPFSRADLRYPPDLPAVNILINCAAELGPVGPLWENDLDAWERTLQADLVLPARLCAWAVPRMSRGGKIINISGGGATKGRPYFSAYACAKVALVRLTETLAAEVAGRGIDVNAIAPGVMRSPMTDAMVTSGYESVAPEQLDARNEIRAADLAFYLASKQCDGITGRLISALWDDWANLHTQKLDGDRFMLRRVT